MTTQTTYSNARANLAALLDEVTANRGIVIINRRGAEDVALVAASELSSLLETAHLLRSPKNAERRLTALNRAKSKRLKSDRTEKRRQGMGLDPKE
jgi:antitoxin YefM